MRDVKGIYFGLQFTGAIENKRRITRPNSGRLAEHFQWEYTIKVDQGGTTNTGRVIANGESINMSVGNDGIGYGCVLQGD